MYCRKNGQIGLLFLWKIIFLDEIYLNLSDSIPKLLLPCIASSSQCATTYKALPSAMPEASDLGVADA